MHICQVCNSQCSLLYIKALLWCESPGHTASTHLAASLGKRASGYSSTLDLQCLVPPMSELEELELETSEECMVPFQVQPCACENAHQGFVTSSWSSEMVPIRAAVLGRMTLRL
uniref:Uncharacterized protein n=1 Tax=Triticum urartu TaxID=4572 RepID=A0A8R7R5T5_TRIUA